MIEVENINKKYLGKKALDNVSINIEKGKLTSLIGPNGSGKSTLLSIISRIIKMDNGSVKIEGKDLTDWKDTDLAKKISILRQSNNINVRLKIEELVSFGRFPYCNGVLEKEDKKFIDDAINYMELSDIREKYLDELSGGQRQRAYIAMVIAQDTEYILLDEPLNNLDMKHSVHMMKVLRQLTDELNKTVIIVMHDINFASCYSDNIVVLKDGKIIKSKSTEEIIDKAFLEDVYEINFDIKNINNQKICVYF